jgi:hypothetical protein
MCNNVLCALYFIKYDFFLFKTGSQTEFQTHNDVIIDLATSPAAIDVIIGLATSPAAIDVIIGLALL